MAEDPTTGFGPPETGFGPPEDQPGLTRTGTNKAGFPTYHGTPQAPPSFGSRFAEALGSPTSIDELKQGGQAITGPYGTGRPGSLIKNLYEKAVDPMAPTAQAHAQVHPTGQAINQGLKYILE